MGCTYIVTMANINNNWPNNIFHNVIVHEACMLILEYMNQFHFEPLSDLPFIKLFVKFHCFFGLTLFVPFFCNHFLIVYV